MLFMYFCQLLKYVSTSKTLLLTIDYGLKTID
jgi:hypothetical protein